MDKRVLELKAEYVKIEERERKRIEEVKLLNTKRIIVINEISKAFDSFEENFNLDEDSLANKERIEKIQT